MKKHLFFKIFLSCSIAILLVILTIKVTAAPVLLPDLIVSDIKVLGKITDDDGYDVYPVEVHYKNIGNKRAYLSAAKQTYIPTQLVREFAANDVFDLAETTSETYDVPEASISYLDPNQIFVKTNYISPDESGHISVRATIDYRNDVHEITENNNTKTKRFFIRSVDNNDALILEEDAEYNPCVDSSGNDGFFSGCLRNKMTHLPSGITFKVLSYDSREASFYLKGAKKAFFTLPKGGFRQLLTRDGRWVNVKYAKNTKKEGVFLEVVMTYIPLEDTSRCLDSNGKDGDYTACPLGTVSHETSGIDLMANYYDEDTLILFSKGMNDWYTTLKKDVPFTSLLKNGYEMTFVYNGLTEEDENNEDGWASFSIESEAPATCEDISGEDGRYAICKGDKITHTISDVTLELLRHIDDEETDRVYFIIRDPDAGLVRIDEGDSVVFMSDTGYEVTFEYVKGQVGHGYYFDISSEFSRSLMSCENSSGNDDIYNACTANIITHLPSGAEIRLISYDDEQAEFLLEGIGDPINAVIPKDEIFTLDLEENYTMSIQYTHYTKLEGAFVTITSDIPVEGEGEEGEEGALDDASGEEDEEGDFEEDDQYIDPDVLD